MLFLPDILQFFEAADKPGGGNAGDDPKEDPKEDSHKDMFGEDSVTYDDLMKEDNPPEKKDTGKSADEGDQLIEGTKTAEELERQQKKESEEGKKPDSETEKEQPGEKEEGGEEEGAEDDMYLFPELSEEEISRADVVQAIKSFNEIEKWRSTLTPRSQLQALIDKLPLDEQATVIDRLRPIISGKDQIPKGIDTSQPIKLKSKDSEGFESEIELKWDSEEVKTIGSQIRQEMEKEYAPIVEEVNQLKSDVRSSNMALAETALHYFLIDHPELEIRDDPQKQTVIGAMNAIELAGQDHPRIGNKLKLENLMSAVNKNKIAGPQGLESAYSLLYPEGLKKTEKPDTETQIKDAKADEKIIQDQKKKLSLGPGESGSPEDEEDKWLNKMRDPEVEAHNELFNNALKK